MAPLYKIALIQLHPKALSPEHNYSKAAEFIKSAASQGAHLAVLPEYHLLGWVPEDPTYADHCGDWEIYLNKYIVLARDHNICIVPGTIVQRHRQDNEGKENQDGEVSNGVGEEGGDILANVAYFISNKGEVLGQYQKKNLWHPERPHLTSSAHDPHTAFDTPLGPVGLLICWDLAFPEAFRELIASGAKMIIIPTFWTHSDCSKYGLEVNPYSEKLFLESTLTARAFENTCAVVFVNAGGQPGSQGKMTYAGLSRVAMPFLGAMGDETKESEEEGMSIIEVDMEMVEKAEENYKVREDIAKEGWHYTYRHQNTKL